MSKTLTANQLRALEVIRFFRDDPKRWAKGTLAVNKHGAECSAWSKDAVAFCFIGAICNRYGIAAAQELITEAEMRGCFLEDYNDDAKDVDEMAVGVSKAFGL